MSTRYVWERCTIEDYERLESSRTGAIISTGGAIPRLAPQRLTPSGSLLVARYHATNQLEKSARIRPYSVFSTR